MRLWRGAWAETGSQCWPSRVWMTLHEPRWVTAAMVGVYGALVNTRAELEEWRARAYECRIVGMRAGAPLYKFPMFPGEKHDDLREVHDDRS